MRHLLLALLFAFGTLTPIIGHAEEDRQDLREWSRDEYDPFSFQLQNPNSPRNTFWPQVGSFLLPGFDQWWEGQRGAALMYTGLALGGIEVMAHASIQQVDGSSVANQLTNGDEGLRQYLLGNKIYETAGELSLYHSFRSAVRTRQLNGDYRFLPAASEETPDQLLKAPFHFQYLQCPTTFIPIGLALLAVGLDSSLGQHQILASDGFYASTMSYTAGVGEEALFRGYVMPRLMESFDSPFWSNTTSSVLFGAAHIATDNKVPVSQFMFGWYLGWLSQRNQWTISEGIFIHAWWDAILLLYQLSDHTVISKPVLLPLLSTTF